MSLGMSSLFSSREDEAVDYALLGALGGLMGLGLVMVFSASIAISEKWFDNPFHYVLRQAFAMGLGIFAALLMLKIPLSFWEKHRQTLLLVGLGLLILVLLVGREVNGSKRWLPLGLMNFQVSEFMKLVAIIFLAGYLDRHAVAVRENFQAVIRLALPFGLTALLLLLEPDFGSTFVIAVVVTGMLLIAGSPWRYFVMAVVPMLAFLTVMVAVSPYRLQRVTSFLDPWADPFGSGYQLTQALIASGQGYWHGVGLGESVQKLLYLPDAHTDFLFSIYAEEFGYLGVVALGLLYLFIVFRIFAIGRRALNKGLFFGGMIAYGVGIWIILQAMINMGVNLGIFPTKGLTLPLMSYGGSSVLLILMALGLVFRVDYETRHQLESPPQDLDADLTDE